MINWINVEIEQIEIKTHYTHKTKPFSPSIRKRNNDNQKKNLIRELLDINYL